MLTRQKQTHLHQIGKFKASLLPPPSPSLYIPPLSPYTYLLPPLPPYLLLSATLQPIWRHGRGSESKPRLPSWGRQHEHGGPPAASTAPSVSSRDVLPVGATGNVFEQDADARYVCVCIQCMVCIVYIVSQIKSLPPTISHVRLYISVCHHEKLNYWLSSNSNHSSCLE